jgi:hypothetical protein
MVVDDDDDDIPEVVQPEPRGKGKLKVSPSPATNGKPASKGKGKRKVDSTAVNGQKRSSDLVVIDELDDDEPPTKEAKTRTHASASLEEGEIASPTGLEKMKEERDLVRHPLALIQAQINHFPLQYKAKSEQLSESLLQLIQIRNTEPEEQLESMKAQYEAASRGA